MDRTNPSLRKAILASVLAASLISSGCGGSDGGSTDASTVTVTNGGGQQVEISKAEYIRRTDAICAKYHDANVEFGQRLDDANSYDEIEQVAGDAVDSFNQEYRELVAVPLPQDAAGPIALRQTQRHAIDLIDQLGNAASREDADALQVYADDLREVGARGQGVIETYGFKVCGTAN